MNIFNKKNNDKEANKFTAGKGKRIIPKIETGEKTNPFGDKRNLHPLDEVETNTNIEGSLIDEILQSKEAPAVVSIDNLGEISSEKELEIISKELIPAGYNIPKICTNYVRDQFATPEACTIIGRTKHWSTNYAKFGYFQHDRALHTHLIGESGGGKSTLLLNMFAQDMYMGRGGMILDPHGDVAEDLLDRVPPWRIKDVVYLDFTDKSNFIGLNALQTFNGTAQQKQDAAESFIGLMKKQFGSSWGPNLENILRHSLLSLADVPGMTPLEIRPLLANNIFNRAVRSQIKDKAIAEWWVDKFDKMSGSMVSQQTSSIENKISQLISNQTLRNILGQSQTSVNFTELMDNNKIVIVNLSKGHTSELVSNFVGTILVSKVLGAALSRQGRVPEPDRVRFALMIDEFQNFCNEDFATILSEARKYGLSLTVAHQNMGQLSELPLLKNSIENNVQNRIIYGIGPTDGKYMEKFMSPLSGADLVNLPNFNIAVKIRVNRQKARAFTAVTLPKIEPFPEHKKIADLVYQNSLRKYTKPRIDCENEYNERQDYGREMLNNMNDDDESSAVLL